MQSSVDSCSFNIWGKSKCLVIVYVALFIFVGCAITYFVLAGWSTSIFVICLLVIVLGWFEFGGLMIGKINFDNQGIHVTGSFFPHPFSRQYSLDLKYSDIVDLEFLMKDKHSKRTCSPGNYNGLPFIELTMKNGDKKLISLLPFSKKQWLCIQTELLKRNSAIVLFVSEAEFVSTLPFSSFY